MASTRQRLDRVRNISFWMALAGFCAFIAGWGWSATALSSAESLFHDRLFLSKPSFHRIGVYLAGHSLCLAGATTVLCAVIARTFLGRCGRCQKLLSRAMSCGGGPRAISRSLRFCPYCAAPIDEPVAAKPDQTVKREDVP